MIDKICRLLLTMMKLKIATSLLVSLGLIHLFNIPANAQNANISDQSPYQSNEQNPIYGDSEFNPWDFIHNATLFNRRSSGDFAEDTNNQLNTATDEFKKQQLQKLMEMEQQNEQEVIANPDE